MTTHKIEKQDLQHYLDHFSSVMPTQLVEIEVTGLELGDQIEAEWLPLTGVSYDPKSDLVAINLDDKLEHNIRKPQAIYVEEDDKGVSSIEITCAEKHKHILKLKDPVALPASQ